ncbi:hypothetical protein COO09_21510 [Rhizorhabdus dicambivorans]|uniref:DUF1214 domain-containing protein n=2 Tax=Rhizorhabdus dicambivorans TaxID=1850238 RepID=A0A2A4FR64_9SPHN|nr:hypothetical protein CMV14_05855 [Rhizorhabdus dicambivorans]PCE40204.1 hypothetical protein COO09_21510 [Rhizorhabdus dicambivorans]
MANPIANAGQLAAEEEVRQMWTLPQTRAARDIAAGHWRVAHGDDIPPGLLDSFDDAMDGWVTNYLFKATAIDPAAPRLVRNFMPTYRWNGADVPDARMGGDNPDNCYRLAGIAPDGRYRISGRILDSRPAHVSFTLVENWGTSITVATLELPGIAVEADGSFTITIDAEASNGRPNHLTSTPRSKFLFIRDSLMDWSRETPLDLHIERLDAAPALGLEERLDEALRRMREDVPLYYWFFRLSTGKPVNTMVQPVRVAGYGGLITQASSLGHFHLEDDQAAIVRFDPAGACYNSFQMAMWWYRSIDPHRIQSGLTAAQAEPNADGTISVVVSARDPGIANWVDTGGLKNLLPMIRWQGIPAAHVREGPRHWLDIVPFAEIDQHVPDATRIDAVERERRIAQRRRDWDRRTTA